MDEEGFQQPELSSKTLTFRKSWLYILVAALMALLIVGSVVIFYQRPLYDLILTFGLKEMYVQPPGNFFKYYTDSANVYVDFGYGPVRIKSAEPATFVPFPNSLYALDAVHVFFADPEENSSHIVAGADVRTFDPVPDDRYMDAKDKNSEYLLGQMVGTISKDYWIPITEVKNLYYQQGSKIYFGGSFPQQPGYQLSGADPRSFLVLEDQAGKPVGISKDNTHVYDGSALVPYADPNTFDLIYDESDTWTGVEKDASRVYFGAKVIADANPQTFVIIGRVANDEIIAGDYYKDDKNVYYSDREVNFPSAVSAANPATFSLASSSVGNFGLTGMTVSCGTDCFYDAQDKNYKYLQGQVIASTTLDANGEWSPFSKIESQVFAEDKPIIGADAATFVALTCEHIPEGGCDVYYAKDKNHAYTFLPGYGTHVWAGPDPATLTFVYGDTLKDKNNVYIDGKALNGADPATFISLGRAFFKDKDHVYSWERVLNDADPASFKLLGSTSYGTDATRVYYGDYVMKGVELNTFTVFDSGDGWYAKDVHQVYDRGEPIEDWMNYNSEKVDPATFVALNDFYVKDSKHVYLMDAQDTGGGVLAGADPATFTLVVGSSTAACGQGCSYDGKDKSHKYLNGQIVQ